MEGCSCSWKQSNWRSVIDEIGQKEALTLEAVVRGGAAEEEEQLKGT